MHRLVVDTNILHQEGLASRNMQQLGRLADAGLVEIYVPTLVRREFLSRRTMDTLEWLHGTQRDLRNVARRLEFSVEGRADVELIDAALARLRANVGEHIDRSFSAWVARHGVREVPFEPSSVPMVIDEYFAGMGAFRKPKHREDFVDAMISHSIQALAREVHLPYVALQDGAFKTHLSSLGTLRVISSIAEFLAMPEVVEDLSSISELDLWSATVRVELENPEFQNQLREYLISGDSSLLDLMYLDEGLAGADLLEVQPNWGLALNGVAAEGDTRIVFTSDVTFGSDGDFSIGVEVLGKGRLDYAGWYTRDFEDSETVTVESMSGDGACDFREIRQVLVRGYLSISLEEGVEASGLFNAIKGGRVMLDMFAEGGEILP